MLVLQFEVGLIASLSCRQNADVTGEGGIDSLDAMVILQFSAGLIGRCPPGQPDRDLVAELVLDGNRRAFVQGEPIAMTLGITNCGDEPVTRQYSSSQVYDFLVRDARGQEIWRWSHDWLFLAVITEQTFQPGETVIYAEAWNQDDNAGEQVPPGMYEVLGYDAGCRIPLEECDLIDSAAIRMEP